MDDIRVRQVIRSLVEIDMVEMKATGQWGLTPGGRDFLDQIEVMRRLDDRPAAAREERQTGRSAPVGGARSGDDVRPTRRARGKRSERA